MVVLLVASRYTRTSPTHAIIPQAMAQGMAERMHGRMAGAAPMHLVETVTCMGGLVSVCRYL